MTDAEDKEIQTKLALAVGVMIAGGVIGYFAGPALISEEIKPMGYALGGVMAAGVATIVYVGAGSPVFVPH